MYIYVGFRPQGTMMVGDMVLSLTLMDQLWGHL
jgi:hypothetical protein